MFEDVLIYIFNVIYFNKIYIKPHNHKLGKLDSDYIEFNWTDKHYYMPLFNYTLSLV